MEALTGETFLHCVVEQGRVDILKYILEKCDHKDFDFNIAEVEQDRTILHLACEKNQEEMVKLLLEYAMVNPMKKTAGKATAYCIAMSRGHDNIGKLFGAKQKPRSHRNCLCAKKK